MKDGLLLDVPEVKSPRLKWIAKYHISTKFFPGVKEGDEDPDTGDILYPWVAWQYEGKVYPPKNQYGGTYGGATEDDALAEWARWRGKRLWNEEP